MKPFAGDLTPLPPVVTDADWRLFVRFCGATEGFPLGFPLSARFVATLAPAVVTGVEVEPIRTLSTDTGEIQLLGGGALVFIRIAASAMSGWGAGSFDFELRALYPDGASTAVYGARGVVFRGLSLGAPSGRPRPQAPLPSGQPLYRAVLISGQVVADAARIPSLPPTAVYLAPDMVTLGAPAGAVIGDLFAHDPNAPDAWTWSLADDLGGRFAIEGSQLVVGPDGLQAGDVGEVLSPRVTVTDQGGNAYTGAVPVFVLSAGLMDGRLPSQSGLLHVLGMH